MTIIQQDFYRDDISFYSLIMNTKKFLPVLIDLGILSSKKGCKKCFSDMKLTHKIPEEKSYFRCNTVRCDRRKVSVKNDTVLESKNISFKNFLILLYEWSQDSGTERILKNKKLTSTAILAYFKIFRGFLMKKVNDEKKKIGGIGQIVEIDETAVAKRKYNKGRVVKTQWVFGGICRESKEIFITLVENLKKDTLMKKNPREYT